ncbi:MAG TPA: hypothetical protein DET40_06865 [Lentisphaeria bacterium]|nr:MAG: hypothetical protein A2X45_07435 [Lentisphaerae bacterium GWF2_50_93]HCE43251.1 hypothetical protein [Lentisphaeria bacterium]
MNDCNKDIECAAWGSRFPGKTYFPLYLANGVDAMMINLLGSGDAWFEQCDYGAPLSVQRSPGWYKSDRRTHTNQKLAYGIMFPLLEFASAPMLNGDNAVPRDSRQFFDPRNATLTTFYGQKDNETEQWMKVKVTTFLTREHVLVEHYEFLETPDSGTAIAFYLNSPSEAYLHLYERTVKMDRASLKVSPERSMMSYDFVFEKFRGGARSWFDCDSASGTATDRKKDVFVYGSLRTRPMYKGESFTRYLAVLDNEDARNYRDAMDAAIDECRTLGYERIKRRHHKEWRAYFATSYAEIPDPSVSFLYDVGRYMLRANLHPSGFLPMGSLPYLWQGIMFWDAGFVVKALLDCGNLEEAGRILEHLHTYMPEARKLAGQFGASGARLEWTAENRKFTKYQHLVTQIHNNAWWVHIIYSYYRHTNDVKFLRRNIGVMEEFLLFVTDRFIEDCGDFAIISRCEGVDESVTNEKTNDTWTCAVTLKALEDYADAVRTLNRRPAIAKLEEIITKLRTGLDRNMDEKGIMQSFQGGRLPHWGSLIFDLFPEHPALKATLAKMMENYDPEMDLYNFHGVTRYAEKSFPWGNYWAARIFSRVGDPLAHHLLANAGKSVNYFGGLPERVFYHGELFNNWFISAHAGMVWAVNGMLANATGNTLRILGGSHKAWRDVKFKDIYAGEGLRVSAEVRHGKLTKLKVVNLFPYQRNIECLFGQDASPRRLKFRGSARNQIRNPTCRTSPNIPLRPRGYEGPGRNPKQICK